MKSGLILESTLDHKWVVFNENVEGGLEWTKTRDITKGDIIPYTIGDYLIFKELPYVPLKPTQPPYYNVRPIKQPEFLDEDLAWLLGIYTGDGSTHKKGIRIAGNADELAGLEKAKKIILDKFGIEGIIYSRTKGNNADLYANSTYLLEWLRANGLVKEKSLDICTPVQVRKSRPSVMKAFIDGYWEADGCIESGRTQRTWCTISKVMAQQMVVMLRSLGIDACVRKMPPTETSLGTNMRYTIAELKGRSGNIKCRNDYPTIKKFDEFNLTELMPDTVISIEDGECDTYDIEVPGDHYYQANSYTSHNTVSQMVDSSSGIHPRFSEYYIRRIRISATDPLLQLMKDQGYPCLPEVGQVEPNVNTYVLEFPVKSPEGALTVKDVSAIEQLETWLLFKKNYTEHNPSVTIYVKPDEWLSIGKWVWDNWDYITGLSFLPYSDHVYQLAPYEAIDSARYSILLSDIRKVDFAKLRYYEKQDTTDVKKEMACVGGVCEL
jgi:hypothetical protein